MISGHKPQLYDSVNAGPGLVPSWRLVVLFPASSRPNQEIRVAWLFLSDHWWRAIRGSVRSRPREKKFIVRVTWRSDFSSRDSSVLKTDQWLRWRAKVQLLFGELQPGCLLSATQHLLDARGPATVRIFAFPAKTTGGIGLLQFVEILRSVCALSERTRSVDVCIRMIENKAPVEDEAMHWWGVEKRPLRVAPSPIRWYP